MDFFCDSYFKGGVLDEFLLKNNNIDKNSAENVISFRLRFDSLEEGDDINFNFLSLLVLLKFKIGLNFKGGKYLINIFDVL